METDVVFLRGIFKQYGFDSEFIIEKNLPACKKFFLLQLPDGNFRDYLLFVTDRFKPASFLNKSELLFQNFSAHSCFDLYMNVSKGRKARGESGLCMEGKSVKPVHQRKITSFNIPRDFDYGS